MTTVLYFIATHLRTTKSLLGWGGMRLRTYWNTSVCLSNVSHTFHCSRSTSHRWRSRSTRFSTTDGGASTSTDTRQRLRGFPSPTWMGQRDKKYSVYSFRMCSWHMTLGLLKCKNMYQRKKQEVHRQRKNTNLLIVELCVIRAAARHPVFGLFPGLFKQVLKSPFHVSLVRSIIIFMLLAQLTNCRCM